MKQFCAVVLCVIIQLLCIGSARAQFTANSQTVTISGTSSNWADYFGGYVVGSNTCGDVLLIENGGILSNSYGYIGDLGSASNNTAIVTGSGSWWDNSSGLFVGHSGAGNNLVISDGGVLSSEGGVIIGELSGASNNTAIVTGSGSVWTNSGPQAGLILGYAGMGNRDRKSTRLNSSHGYISYA